MLKYFDWCFQHGGEMAQKLDYVPMPESVVKLVEATWAKEITSGGKPVWPAKIRPTNLAKTAVYGRFSDRPILLQTPG